MGRKNTPGRGGSSGKRGRGIGRGTGHRGKFRNTSNPMSSLSLEDRPDSAVDEVEERVDNETTEAASSSGLSP